MTAPLIGLGDPERAAVMIMLLEEDQAAQILSQLGPDELQVLGERMCALGDIGPEQITQILAQHPEFFADEPFLILQRDGSMNPSVPMP